MTVHSRLKLRRSKNLDKHKYQENCSRCIIQPMANVLKFETSTYDELEIPLLVNFESLDSGIAPDYLSLDGAQCSIEDTMLQRLHSVLSVIKNEQLPREHFRDCSHFVMAMCGLWMPTHRPLDERFSMYYECEDSLNTNEDLLGPVMMGIPNDLRCIGFGNIPYIYNHAAYAIDSSLGGMFLQKLGIENDFALTSMKNALDIHENELVHTLNSLWVIACNGLEAFRWSRKIEATTRD